MARLPAASKTVEEQAEVPVPEEEAPALPATASTPETAPPDVEDEFSDEYVEAEETESLGFHPHYRIIVGSDRPEDMRAMRRVGCRQVRKDQRDARDGRLLVDAQELCEGHVQEDGVTYLWFGGGPLWAETWQHWKNREQARHAKRRQKFGQIDRENTEQVGTVDGVSVG